MVLGINSVQYDWEDFVETDFQWNSLSSDGKVYSIAEFETDNKKHVLRDECIIDGYTYIRKEEAEEEAMEFKIGNCIYSLSYNGALVGKYKNDYSED